jgi:cytidylate kinase
LPEGVVEELVIVTISNEYGTRALSVAKLVAAELGYEYVDQQLPIVVAKRLRVTAEEVEAAEDSARTIGERLLSGLEVATPEVMPNLGETFDAACLREVQSAVREYAASGNVVLIGRGAGVILGRRPDVLRVFMYAPRDWRVHTIMEMFGKNEHVAATEVDRIDRARRAYLRDWYGVDFGNPQIYDLSIDTATFDVDGSAQIVLAAVRARA